MWSKKYSRFLTCNSEAPIAGSSIPPTARSASRIGSASSRRGLNRQSSRFSGSTRRCGVVVGAHLVGTESMMSSVISLIDQPPFDEPPRQPIQERRIDGAFAEAAEVVGRGHEPLAEMPRQSRLTITRLVRGCPGSVRRSGPASRRPLLVALKFGRPDPARTRGSVAGRPRPERGGSPGCGPGRRRRFPSVTPIADGTAVADFSSWARAVRSRWSSSLVSRG